MLATKNISLTNQIMMKLNTAQLHQLRELLKEIGLTYEDDELEQVGVAIMRLVLQKELRMKAKEPNDGRALGKPVAPKVY